MFQSSILYKSGLFTKSPRWGKIEVFKLRKEVIGVNNKISYKAGASCKKLASFSEESCEEKVIEN